MKRIWFFVWFLLSGVTVWSDEVVQLGSGKFILILDDHTWKDVSGTESLSPDLRRDILKRLRQGVSASESELNVACELYLQGWRYSMPLPKSAQAAWGNGDKRTTWWYGYWYNTSGQVSDSTPKKTPNGQFQGDFQNRKGSYRNDGSPPRPDVFMFLLSENGGPAGS